MFKASGSRMPWTLVGCDGVAQWTDGNKTKTNLFKMLFDLFNSFEKYQENSTRNMNSGYKHKFQFPYERIEDPTGMTLLFQNYWHHTITIGVLLNPLNGQCAIESRLTFAIICPFGTWLWRFLAFVGRFELPRSHLPICCPKASLTQFATRLIFLHYYHHAAVLVYSAHSGAEHTAASSLFLPMNFFAHSLMYSYYALNSLGYKMPRWLAMAVTIVQTTQMLCGVAITAVVFKLKVFDGARCQQSMGNLYLAIFLYSTFAVLFIKFFYAAYLRKEKRRIAAEQKKVE
uniref:Elongation of very long chain fatty acids protein n=1 Tax=Globodera pallida TaxID=36090 RepID=A0A183CG29_GLOPA